MDEREKDIKQRFDRLANELNERTRRLLAASEAMTIGRGGITLVSRATGLSRKAISLGIKQLQEKTSISPGRIRSAGGGRKKTVSKDLSLDEDLERLVEPVTRGDPESPLPTDCATRCTFVLKQPHKSVQCSSFSLERDHKYRSLTAEKSN